jgi:hypothetical protein
MWVKIIKVNDFIASDIGRCPICRKYIYGCEEYALVHIEFIVCLAHEECIHKSNKESDNENTQ